MAGSMEAHSPTGLLPHPLQESRLRLTWTGLLVSPHHSYTNGSEDEALASQLVQTRGMPRSLWNFQPGWKRTGGQGEHRGLQAPWAHADPSASAADRKKLVDKEGPVPPELFYIGLTVGEQ